MANEVDMVNRTNGYSDTEDEGAGIRYVERIVATFGGETHIYQFPNHLAWKARAMVKRHVEDGILHPYAGLLLVGMLRRGDGS